MQALQVFNFKGAEVRTVMAGGEMWWATKDVCAILEIKDSHTATRKLHGHEKGRHLMPTPGGDQVMACVNRTGLLKLIGRSDKPSAVAFQDWTFGEVIPSVLETGGYVAPGQEDRFAAILAELQSLKQQQAAPMDAKTLIAASIASKLELLSPAVQKIVVTTALALPPEAQAIWTATQIADELCRLGVVVTAQKVGLAAKAHGVQCPKGEQENEYGYWAETSVNNYAKIVPQYIYRKAGRDRLVAIFTAAHAGAVS